MILLGFLLFGARNPLTKIVLTIVEPRATIGFARKQHLTKMKNLLKF